jgi:probable rRNA maturation factor
VRVSAARLRRAVRAALAGASLSRAHISLALVDDRTIARLNRRFLGHRGPTDVLSFLLDEGPGRLEGEVVVSGETARRQAARYGQTPEDELLLYVVHGVLHLAGYDDHSAPGRRRMTARQEEILGEARNAKEAPNPKQQISNKPKARRSNVPNG